MLIDNNVSEITRNQAVSDATIQSGLGVAKNYGLFSLDATSHNDLECSVAAKYADLGADYNFSGNNTKVYKNQLTVSKSFMINNQPQANKNVTLRLYRMDSSQSVLIDVMTQTTDSNGNAKFVFDGMKDSSSNKRYSFLIFIIVFLPNKKDNTQIHETNCEIMVARAAPATFICKT